MKRGSVIIVCIVSIGFCFITNHNCLAEMQNLVDVNNLVAISIDEPSQKVYCRTLPFLTVLPEKRTSTKRIITSQSETIPMGVKAETLYLLGMINEGWDQGVAFWPEHPELNKQRMDQLYVGVKIGDVIIRYADGSSDSVPLIMGMTAWFHNWWSEFTEPFNSRPELLEQWNKHRKLREDRSKVLPETRNQRYFLAIKPQAKMIESLVVQDNPMVNGRPLVAGITVSTTAVGGSGVNFANEKVDSADITPIIISNNVGDWSADINAMADMLYTSDKQLPTSPPLLQLPKEIDAASITFSGGQYATMLSNIWVANFTQIAKHKFDPETGFFGESQVGCPSYSGYTGIGTWKPSGAYAHCVFARSSDHFATVSLRCLHDDRRLTNYVDFCDKYLYFYRSNHDPNIGPPNIALDLKRYPVDAPPHWSFVLNIPLDYDPNMNEIQGTEESDGTGATIIGRWYAWKLLGMPVDGWLTAPRKNVYGKSRWDSSRDSADFICWLMDYTGRDVMYSEGECTGGAAKSRLTADMNILTDEAATKRKYANVDMYEPYPTFMCFTALKCSAQIADSIGQFDIANKWRNYAKRLHDGMIRLLASGDRTDRTWRISYNSIWPTPQDSLVQAFLAVYEDGFDPQRLDPVMTPITRNTLRHRIAMPSGYNAALGMGYGLGWQGMAALILDEMDDAGKIMTNIARYSYDKNMDYYDVERKIDWRQWRWLIPEGTNVLPDGRWHRIGDLSNGANQGNVIHAMEVCAGIDDTDANELRILPRVARPMQDINVVNYKAVIKKSGKFTVIRLSYTYARESAGFTFKCSEKVPLMSVRLGPFPEPRAHEIEKILQEKHYRKTRPEQSGTFDGQPAWWIWLEKMENISEVSVNL